MLMSWARGLYQKAVSGNIAWGSEEAETLKFAILLSLAGAGIDPWHHRAEGEDDYPRPVEYHGYRQREAPRLALTIDRDSILGTELSRLVRERFGGRFATPGSFPDNHSYCDFSTAIGVVGVKFSDFSIYIGLPTTEKPLC